MSRKKKLLKKTRYTKVYDTETGPVTEMEGVTVTPEGNGIGLPATSDDMIPEGAELSDAERRELEARYGARVMNQNMDQAGHILGQIAMTPAYFSPVGWLAGAATGVAGFYNQYQNGDFQRAADIMTSDQNLWDKTKQVAPIALETGLNTAMVAPAIGATALYGIGRYGSGAMQQGARNYLVGRNFRADIQPWQLQYTQSGKYEFNGSPYIQKQNSTGYKGITFPGIIDTKSTSEVISHIKQMNPGDVTVFRIPKQEADLISTILPKEEYNFCHNGIVAFFAKRVPDQTKQFLDYLRSYLSPDSQWYQNMLNNGYTKQQTDDMAQIIMKKAQYQNKYDWEKMFLDPKTMFETEGQMDPTKGIKNQIDINALIMDSQEKSQKAIHEYLGHSIDADAVRTYKTDPFTRSLVINRILNVDSIVDEILKSQKFKEFYNGVSNKEFWDYMFKKNPLYGYGEFRSRLLEHMNGQNSEKYLTQLREKGVISDDQWKRLMSHMAAIAPFIMYTQKKDED